MERKNKYILLLFLIFIFQISFEDNIDFRADKIVYIDSLNTIILKDNIIIQRENLKITCDSVYINRNKNVLFAFGNLILKHYDMIIKGDSVYYNYKDNKSIIFNGDSKIEKGYFFGQRISTSNNHIYTIGNGHFTTCEYVKNPHYKISSARMKYIENDRIELFPAILYLKNVPVFGLPFAVIPAATVRKTGFLMPSFGYTESDGFYIRDLSYFWAINGFSDMTFTVDYYTRRSFWIEYEWRIIVNPYMNFLLNSYFVNEFSGNKRWSLSGTYAHNLPFDIALKSKWDIMSDINIFTDYDDTSVVALKKTTETFVSLSKDFRLYSSYISFSRNQDYFYSTIRYSLPIYRGYFNRITLLKNKYIFPKGLNYSHSHGISNEISIDSVKSYNRTFYLNNVFNTNYMILKYFLFQPSFSANYFNYIDNDAKLTLNANLILNTHIYGVSIFGIYPYERFRHTLIPSIKFTISENKFMKFDSYTVDSSKISENIVLSLANNFEGKIKNRKDMLLRLTMSIAYNMKIDSFSVLSLNAVVFPGKLFNMNMIMNYDIYNKNKNYLLNISFNQKIKNPFSKKDINILLKDYLKIENQEINEHQLTLNTTFAAGKLLNLNIMILYNLLDYSLVSSSFGINRDLHCWNASFNISTYGDILKYDFKISLKEFPEISLDKGLLGPLFY